MTEKHIICLLFRFIMLACLYVSGRNISRLTDFSFRSLWKAGWVGIVAFTLNEGLRFGRGLDYNLYAAGYEDGDNNWDLGFLWVTDVLRAADLPWTAMVMIMGFVLIISVLMLIRNFPKAAPIALPAMYFFMGASAENLMRWYFALSFVMIGFSYYLENLQNDTENVNKKRNLIIFFGFSALSFLFHFGLIFIPVIYYLVSRIKKPMLNPWITIVLFLVVGMSFQTSMMKNFSDVINMFAILNSERTESYVANADQWLTGGSDILTFSAFPSPIMCVIYSLCILAGYYLCRDINDRRYTTIYNLVAIGFILFPIGKQIEILNRYDQTMFYLQFIVWGYIFYYAWNKWSIFINSGVRTLTLLLMLYYCYSTTRSWMAVPEYQTLYVWDANGEKYLDLQSTYYFDLFNKQRGS